MRKGTWLGFAVFCLLTGSRWLLDQTMPPPLSTLLRTALHDALLCAILCGWMLLRDSPAGTRKPAWPAIALAVTAIFVLPYAVIELAGSKVTGFTETLVFALVPAFVVFFVAQQDWEFGERADPRRLLGPALAGVCGAALVIEFRWPFSLAGDLWLISLIASAVLASYAAIRLHALLRGVPVLQAAALAAGIIAFAGIAVSWTDLSALKTLDGPGWFVEAAIALLLDGPLLLLSVWLLRELPPIAFATRYLLFLLVTIIETYAIVRGPLVWTTGAGMLLIAGGSAWLLRESGATADSADTPSH